MSAPGFSRPFLELETVEEGRLLPSLFEGSLSIVWTAGPLTEQENRTLAALLSPLCRHARYGHWVLIARRRASGRLDVSLYVNTRGRLRTKHLAALRDLQARVAAAMGWEAEQEEFLPLFSPFLGLARMYWIKDTPNPAG